ncbi:MAG: Zn-dependent oligopeptidase [Verrucomicrobiota bacterium]|nr:Zn-dependent oligopeptidase [Verrucomicrobiota bacterium]
MKYVLLVSLLLASAFPSRADDVKSLSDFQAAADKANAVLTIPKWPKTPIEVQGEINTAIAKADAALTVIGKQDLSKVTFESTVGALDNIQNDAGSTISKTVVIQQTNQDAAMREAAEKTIKVFQDWAVGIDYREDVYKAVKAFADTKPKLEGEDALLLEQTLRDYRRAGLALPLEKRAEVEKLRKELAKLETDFQANIVAVKAPIVFTKAELEGVPDSILESPGVKTGDDSYTILANVTFHYNTVEETAKKEETRKHLYKVRFNLAREKNVPILNDILKHRNQLALKLGYKSWDDFQTEIKMAKSGASAKTFINDLVAGIQPKFDAEVAALRKLKVAETKDPNTQINMWDWRYYQTEYKKEKYTVDTEALRVYFPFQRVLDGMFNIYQNIFGLKFTKIIPPQKWVDDLQLYVVADSASGEPLGLFYLDMFPRDGKFNHFAEFGIVPGKLLPDGKYQRPTVALVCNFPPPSKDKPSLLSHSDVETLFHEFGHALHAIVTNAKYVRFSGTSVPADFVEAPSQMLQNWVWDKKVLDTFAADYRDPSKKIPAELIAKMKEAKLATVGVHYRRQFTFGDVDLTLHDVHPEGQAYDSVAISNPIFVKDFLPIDPDTAFVAYFGHLAGYDAGYYGYAWADAIAADMATVFENAPNGFLDKAAGIKLRKEIYAPGGSRDIDISIRNFLGRDRSVEPYLKTLGIEKAGKTRSQPAAESQPEAAPPQPPKP